MYAIASKVPIKGISIKNMLKLFDTCISPILLYGSEVWGPYLNINYKNWESTPIEKLHTQYIKRLLRVNRSTTNFLTRADTGRNPLMAPILAQNINYIKYEENKNDSTLAKQALNYEKTLTTGRSTILTLLQNHENGFKQNLKENEHIMTVGKFKLRKVVYEVFNTLWQQQIPTYPKADTCKLFKNRIKLEKYLTIIDNRKLRVMYTEFRLSDHKLAIEEGRRKRPFVPREQRMCPLCSLEVENEIHFLIHCNKYDFI